MIFREPLRSMLHPMATELCGIWLAMESEQRFMKIRRFPTMHRKEEASAYRRNTQTWAEIKIRNDLCHRADDQCRNLAGTIPAGWLDGRYKGWLLVSALRKHDSGDRWGTGDPDVVLRRTQMVGKLAVSLAGHDKGSIFLVIREDGDVMLP